MDATKTDDALRLQEQLDSVPPGALAVEALAGAAAGAALGAIAGPPGAIAGAVIGGAIGTAAAAALHRGDQEKAIEEEALDRDLGVIGGDLGAAPPDAPGPQRGAYHAASLGLGGGASPVPSEGVMQNVEGD